MRFDSGALSRYRPRRLTLLVLIAVSTLAVLAQFPTIENSEHGWPLSWYWRNLHIKPPVPPVWYVVRYNWPRLVSDLATWVVLSAVAGVACEWLLRRYQPRWHRPRVLTLIVLIAVAAPALLANLSPSDVKRIYPFSSYKPVEFGWPLSWYWRDLDVMTPAPPVWLVIGYSWPRLAGNLAIALVILPAAGVVCEWLLRRYRPRLRWNLKTMLLGVGLMGILCGWCASLRDRANVQDPLIAEIEKRSGYSVYLKRWGPKWLDLFGADRFRRRIVGARPYDDADAEDEIPSHLRSQPEIDDDELVRRLGRLPDLRYLALTPGVGEWTPAMAAVLGDMKQLRILLFRAQEWPDDDDSRRMLNEVLAAIGKLNQLEVLSWDARIPGDGLAHLAGLTNLKSLRIDNGVDQSYNHDFSRKDERELEHLATIGKLPLLAHLPALPRLESLCFGYGLIRDRDVRHLAHLPCLKSLDLIRSSLTDAAWRELACLESVEELYIDYVDAWGVEEGDVDAHRRALEALRQSNPGIVIDREAPSFEKRCVWRGWRFDKRPPPADSGLPMGTGGTGAF